jgi:hypothetical protein
LNGRVIAGTVLRGGRRRGLCLPALLLVAPCLFFRALLRLAPLFLRLPAVRLDPGLFLLLALGGEALARVLFFFPPFRVELLLLLLSAVGLESLLVLFAPFRLGPLTLFLFLSLFRLALPTLRLDPLEVRDLDPKR